MNPDSKPKLASHARLRNDPITGTPLLLYPEGALELSGSAAAVLKLCDGVSTVRELSLALADEHDAPADEIEADILPVLSELRDRALIVG